jgi:DNA-binding SARP family transcriptional activator
MALVEQAATAPEGVRVRLLGPFEVEGADLSTLRSRKARTLLKVLALAGGRPVSVDRLVDCLWGDEPPMKAEREVAVNASRARSVVGSDNIERTDGGYRLRVAWSDLDALAELEDEAQRRLAVDDAVAARAAAGAGLALVRADFLCDEPDPSWAEVDRAAVEGRIAALRRVSARAALSLGALGLASSEAEQLLAADPFDEDALRVLMTAQAAAGRSGSAAWAYSQARARLRDELGVDPTPATEAVHLAILRGDALPGVPAVIDGPEVAATGSATDAPPGRTDELHALDDARRAATEALTVVVLDGEPGAGKTTVLDAFARRARAAHAIVLRASCDTTDLPLEPIGAALAALVRWVGPEEGAALLGAEAEVLAPLLGTDDAASPRLPGPSATSEALTAMLHGALTRVFARLAQGDGTSVVLLLDDAHLAGPSTVDWLRHIRRRREPPMLVVLAGRMAPPGDGEAVVADRTVVVGPLGLDAATAIAGPDRAPALLERSGGNALFLAELAAAPDDELPESIRAAALRRLAGAGPTVTATLQAAAVLGDAVDLDLLAGVLQRSPLDALDDVEVGLDRHLLVEREGRLVFRHALVRDALAAEVSVARRSLLHREAARILGDRPEADPLVVAQHARRAGDLDLAAHALARAATAAAARFDLAEAERLLTDALGLSSSAERLVQRGRVRLARADLDGAEADALAAVADGGGAPALELRAWVARFRHDMETAIRVGTEAAERSSDPTTKASSLLAVAFAHRGLGELDAAEADLQAAIAIEGSEALGARGWLGVLRVHQGRPREALDLLEPVVGAEVQVIHGFWVEHTLQMTAHAYAMTGRVVDALALLDRLERELVRRGSSARYAGGVENYRGWILRNLADPSGREQAVRSMEVASPTMPELRAQSMLDLADDLLRSGEVDGATARLDDADEAMRVRWFQNRWRCEARHALLRAQLALATGHPDAAEAHAAEVVEGAEGRGDVRYAVLGRLALARARAGVGGPVDRDAVAADLARLPEVAALEAWWTTALVARDLRVDEWSTLAEERAASLGRGAGDHEPGFLERARRWLDAV